ncbi:MAG: alpha/beta hydrolase [Candidatus Bathyarchaeota archaeon]|nr:alpha/beta hydrolase [Candidatus Bathyarchaeota archaeon]
MKLRFKIIIGVLLVVVFVFGGFIAWAETPPTPMDEAFDALESDSAVEVSVGDWLVFEPVSLSKNVGFIIYPGGRVDFRSYAPIAHRIAERGYFVVIVKMPLNLAVFGVNKANEVIDSCSMISSWVVGGHSLGGSMAAQFAYENPSKVNGLVLWAAYPASGTNLSKYDLLVSTIYGSNDGLVSSSQIDDSLKLLPASTIKVNINGGNHAQVGWYGEQSGDNLASITREEQQNQIVNATVKLLEASSGS